MIDRKTGLAEGIEPALSFVLIGCLVDHLQTKLNDAWLEGAGDLAASIGVCTLRSADGAG